MMNFTLKEYVLAMIWGAVNEQASSDAPRHPDFYELTRRFAYQLRVEHPALDLTLKTNRLFGTFYAMLSARRSEAREYRPSEQVSASA